MGWSSKPGSGFDSTFGTDIGGGPAVEPEPKPEPKPLTPDELAKEQWEFYKKLYLPTEQALAKQARTAIPVDYLQARATQDIGKTYSKQQGIAQRTAERFGAVAGDGNDAQTQMIRRAAEIGARNLIKSGAKDTELDRMNVVAQLGQGIPATTSSATSALAGFESANKLQQAEAQSQLINALLGGAQGAYSGWTGNKAPTVLSAARSGYNKMFGTQQNQQQQPMAYNFTPQTQAYYGSAG